MIDEALSDAVYHRVYDVREPIEVRIEPDRIEIVSYPGWGGSFCNAGKIGLKGSRTRKLLNELVVLGAVSCTAVTKNKRYVRIK